ncbi:MAG: type IV secretory system conjugative DNA transfer family protein [Saccharofermentans sp.]|nr:type IV secretory system conjugative DNA transfer family protein [Saccharofermentans sp.]
MRKVTNKFSGPRIALYFSGLIPVSWFALKSAPYFVKNGLVGVFENAGDIFNNPFRITIVQGSLQVVLIFGVLYAIGIGIYLSTEKNYRRREEHGSAKWGDAVSTNKRYQAKPEEANKILTQNVRIGFDGHKHKRNLNVLVVGGAGAGKTRYYAMPNILQADKNTKFSMVILDPKGGTLRSCGNYLIDQGYDVRVLDLINLDRSHCYNPFVYLESDDDVQRLTTNLIKNTTPKGSQTTDPFWDQAASMLLKALVFYLFYEAPPEEQNFPMVMDMIRAGDVKENDDDYESPLDILFSDLEEQNPEHIALKYYRGYRSGAAQTIKSIQISLIARLEKFNLPSLAGITQTDEMRLRELGEKPGAIFALIPDNDQSYNFIIGMLYTQLFQQLYRSADFEHGGRLPYHVHFIMDEFANVCLPDSFDSLLATMRSREISVSIILQNLAQLKALFEKKWESIVGNCDEFLYLGGNEQGTHKYVSELLGKETIDTNSYGQNKGRNGSFTKNDQLQARDLMTPDEVRMLDNRYGILFIRGEYPVMDLKYDLMKHPKIAFTEEGGAQPFIHGRDTRSLATVKLVGDDPALRDKAIDIETLVEETHDFEVLSNEELEDLYQTKEI